MTGEFAADVRIELGVGIISVSGEIDIATAPLLEESIEQVLDKGVDQLDLDMQNVPFMDSQGIGLAARTLRSLEGNGGKLRIVNPSPQVEKVLSISGLDKLLEVVRNPA
ncbi:MAG: STAS domain-containing protein [Actinobacteria bacterium]|nr:STAS domain-containing protein [Actinomycetota bacterium]